MGMDQVDMLYHNPSLSLELDVLPEKTFWRVPLENSARALQCGLSDPATLHRMV